MAAEKIPVANITPFGLRMQPDLKAKVEEAARTNNRSLNSEIVARLEYSFQPEFMKDANLSAAMQAVFSTMQRRLDTIDDKGMVLESASREDLEAELAKRDEQRRREAHEEEQRRILNWED